MIKKFGKKDGYLLGCLAVVLLIFSGIFYGFFGKDGAAVKIMVKGNLYGIYSLEKDALIEIKCDGVVTNILEISNGKADMTKADCPDLLCVHQKEISKVNETIVCLPNQVVVEISGTKEAEFDSMT